MKRIFEWQGNGLICIGPLILPVTLLISCCRQDEIAWLPKAFCLALSGHSRPRVINVDGHPAYPAVIEELKQSAELGRKCQCRPSPYMNNIIEQDHRFVKKRVMASQWFRSVEGALHTVAGYEAMTSSEKARSAGSQKATSWDRHASLSAHSASLPDIQAAQSMHSRPHPRVCDTTGCPPRRSPEPGLPFEKRPRSAS